MDSETKAPDPSEQMRHEILNVIERYTKEADLTYCQIFGVIEVVKIGLVEGWMEQERKK